MNTQKSHQPPTLFQLLKATVLAVIVAGVVLVSAVLPAEFGIDPTGLGKMLGLTALNNSNAQAASLPSVAVKPAKGMESPGPVTPQPEGLVIKSKIPYRSDEMSITLKPGEGTEIKVTMRKGEQLVYNWASEGGPVNVDLHGEKTNDDANSISYWKGMQLTSDQGIFIAPYDGTHGWFWRNRSDNPVTVKVRASGFYEKFTRLK